MNFLLIFGSTEGQTQKIAKTVAAQLREAGHDVEIFDSRRRMAKLDMSLFDAVILAGSVHGGVHQETFSNFVVAHRRQLETLPTMLLSVSLSVVFENGQAEARKYVDRFVQDTGFTPDRTVLVAGALRFREYDYFMSHIIEHVVLKDRERITEDREFTDWNSLRSDVSQFVASITD